MDTVFFTAIVPIMVGAFSFRMSAHHIEAYLAKNDADNHPPGMAARFFLGPLFTTIPRLGRYAEFRAMEGAKPIGVWGFWGGLALSLFGLVLLFAGLSTI